MIVTGGKGINGNTVKDVEIWTETQGWKTAFQVDVGMFSHQMVTNNKNVYLLGGYSGSFVFGTGTYVSKIWKLNLDEEKLVYVGDFKVRRAYHVAFCVPYGYLQQCKGMR